MIRSHFLALVALPMALAAAPALAQSNTASFADDRAHIEQLHAEYLFAYDWHDIDSYLATFTKDAVLDYGGGVLKGHDAIRAYLTERRAKREQDRTATPAGESTPVGRHIISNTIVKIEGNKAHSVAYWTHMTAGKTGYGTVDFFGHYEDDLEKVDGKWLYTHRRVYNQAVAPWAARDNNPVNTATPAPQLRSQSQSTSTSSVN